MSNDPNAQYQYALDNLGQTIKDSPGPMPASLGVSIAQVQATLALTFEQRTANLIAIYRDNDIGNQGAISYENLAKQIKERTGL